MKTVIKTSLGGPFLRPYFILTATALGLLALCPRMQAVIPPPGGGYPGANTAAGDGALLNLTTGDWNTAIGFVSLTSITTGQFNTGVGAGTLYRNTGDQITAAGAFALFNNTTGQLNTATGALALFSNTTGQDNTANGASALKSNTTGHYNTAFGSGALASNVDAGNNTAIGYQTLFSNSSEGVLNTAVGYQALFSNNGFIAVQNTAVGAMALYRNTTGGLNTALGEGALMNSTTGSNNTALGTSAGINQTTGSNNVYIGAGINGIAGESNACRIASIFGQTAANGSAVFITSGNKLGMTTSSKRFKEDIKSMDKASEAVFALKPVSFRYKKEVDPTRTAQFGLVAEDVEKVNPDLIVRDKDGKPYSVRYDQVNAMLLNEFLKEHGKVEKLEAALDTVKKRLNEQDARIQKVSAEVEVSEPAAKTAFNSH